MKKIDKRLVRFINEPFLDTIKCDYPKTNNNHYPFSLSIIKHLQEIKFPSNVTFFIGENGTGKSTILEAIACKAGFGLEGGSKNIHFKTSDDKHYQSAHQLAECLTLSWRIKPTNGYFFRAESFFNVANYLDRLAREGGQGQVAYDPYGGKSLHEQSHGESFLSFFENRMNSSGFFILDEPEAALSPQRQLTLLAIMNKLVNYNAQFIIATHSPILLAYPNATIYSCDSGILTPILYTDTSHYEITKSFLNNPGQYLHHLFED